MAKCAASIPKHKYRFGEARRPKQGYRYDCLWISLMKLKECRKYLLAPDLGVGVSQIISEADEKPSLLPKLRQPNYKQIIFISKQ